MIGPAGVFAAPKPHWKPWRVKAYVTDGRLWEDQGEESEADARELAARMGTVRGQKGWRVEVYGPDGYVTTYKGGKEVKRKEAKP